MKSSIIGKRKQGIESIREEQVHNYESEQDLIKTTTAYLPGCTLLFEEERLKFAMDTLYFVLTCFL